MKKSDITTILLEKDILNFEHELVFKFFEKKIDNSLKISTVEILHLGKRIRLFSSYTELVNTLHLNSNLVHLKLDAATQLYAFANRQNYSIIKTNYTNSWADYSIQVKKTIELKNLVDEIYIILNYYYNLCLDYNSNLKEDDFK